MSYHPSSSRCVWGSVRFCFRMSAKIVRVSATGMFVYRFEMSSDARVKWGSTGVSFSLCIRPLELSMLNALGRRVRWPAFCLNSLASLYAGAFRQFTAGRLGWSGLGSFIRQRGSCWCISILSRAG